MQTKTSQFLTKEIVDQIFLSGELTRDDRKQIQSMLLDESIGENELILVERVMEGVVKGIRDVLYSFKLALPYVNVRCAMRTLP